MTWRSDMENAPRDGTEILICHLVRNGHNEVIGRAVEQASWWDAWYDDKAAQGWMPANLDEEYGCLIEDVTHWMPLPAPPEDT